MLLTEDEARRKRCQEKLANPSVERGLCLGSDCMAWRIGERARPIQWDKIVPHPDDVHKRRQEGYEPDPNHVGGLRKKISDARPARGFCGKAGGIPSFE